MNVWNKLLVFFPIWLFFSMVFYAIVFLVFPEAFSGSKTEFDHLISTNYAFLFLSQLAALLGILGSILFISKFIEKEKPKIFKSMFHLEGILYGIILGFIVIMIILLIISSLYKIQITFNKIGIESLWYIVIFFCVAISEELMSRGFIFINLYYNSNKHLAILISSIIFSLLHSFNSSFNILGMINILLIGILLCLLYLKNMNLSIPIGFHFSWNLLQGPILGFSVSGLNTSSMFEIINIRSDGFPFRDFGLEGSLISTIVIGVFVIYFYFFKRDIIVKMKGLLGISNIGISEK